MRSIYIYICINGSMLKNSYKIKVFKYLILKFSKNI